MARQIAQEHSKRLESIKESVEQSYEYFSGNYDRYHEFMKFVFESSLTAEDVSTLKQLKKPTIECNILEAYISRLRGEFAKQEPSLTVRASDGVPIENLSDQFINQLKVIEAHLRAIFFDGENDELEYNVYTDLLAGGFSVVEVYTDFLNSMSFDMGINVSRVFDPTLCGFDPLARDSHKGDGRYCFQIFPRTREEFEREFPDANINQMKFTRNFEGFNWSYRNEKQDIVLICDFYEKKKKRIKIIKLTNGRVVTEKDYKKLLEWWEANGILEQPPQPIGKSRWSERETIVRYRLCENQILDYIETNYEYLPLVFIDGNSMMIKNSTNGAAQQMTRPFVYHARGVQKLKNFAFQTIANEIENMEMHKYMAPVESIPEDYQDSWKDPQSASVLLYNAYSDGNPDMQVPPPREVSRIPTPPIVNQAFQEADSTTQMILGSYDASLGINGNQISGVAIQQGAMQSNAAAMPYIMGYIKGINRVAQIIVDLIPKYYVTPRSIPILLPDGKRDYKVINQQGSMYMNYDPHDLQVKVEAGVNFQVQKQVALESIIRIMQASPTFNQFINEYGLEILLDNMDIRGIEELKEQADKFMKQQQQQQAAQSKMAVEMNPAMLQYKERMAGIAQRQREAEMEQVASMSKVAVDKQEADTEFLKAMSEIGSQRVDNQIRKEQLDAENARTAVDLAISVAKHNQGE